MLRPYRHNLAGTGIDDPDLLVLASGGDERTLVVPVDGLDDVGVTINVALGGALLDVPHLDGVIGRRRGEHVAGGRVPADVTDLPLVAREVLHGVAHGLGQAICTVETSKEDTTDCQSNDKK